MARTVGTNLNSWSIGEVRQVREREIHRISLDVGGVPLWFESPDVELRAGSEPFVVGLLFPALHGRVSLRRSWSIDPVLRSGLRKLADTYRSWWNYPADNIAELPTAEPANELTADLTNETANHSADKLTTNRANEPAATQVGLCFSGGVDSFYSLLTSIRPIDSLLLVHGFDIPLADQQRWDHAEAALRNVARELGKQAIVVRTNLREHPVCAGIDWQRSHGSALAAVGHALSGTLGTLVIPPSYRADRLCPWGSDPRTDPLYSSARLRIEHPPSNDGRPLRIATIAHHPLVRRHLRVCYENRSSRGNCSRCEKCLSTMTVFDGLGQLPKCTAFDQTIPLSVLLDQLPAIEHHSVALWREIEAMDHDPDVQQSLRRLFERRPPRGLQRAYWRLRRRWFFARRPQAA